MTGFSRPTSLAKRPWSTLLWGWGLVLVVLLSAAPTGGPPRTRLVGSAFDPATVSVAISPRQPKIKATAEQAKPDEPGKVTPQLPIAVATAALPELAAFDRSAPAAFPIRVTPDIRRLVRPLGARAPPLNA